MVTRTEQNLKSIQREIIAVEQALMRLGMTSKQVANLGIFAEKKGLSLADLDLEKTFKEGITGARQFSFENEQLGTKMKVVQTQLGEIRGQAPQTFKTLAQGVQKNIVEFTKWSAAITLVYMPLQFLSQQMKEVVDIQDELASAMIVVSNTQKNLNSIFEASSRIADQTSTGLTGVIEGYNLAIRSISNYTDEADRMHKAQILLEQSLILSKLAGIDQAKATDLIVASLKQLGLTINDAGALLDRWVTVSKEANVSIETLAAAYSIMGSVAQSAGIQVGGATDQLAGLVAVLSEATPKSATETANALRTIVSGFTTDSAQNELRNLGVAVNTLEGDFLGFYELAGEVNRLFKSGVISEAQLGAVSRAIGGGTRRQADVEAIIRNLDRVREINRLNTQQGAAYGALEIKTDTLSSAFTELKNAVIELGQTLGTSGGFLDLLTSIADALKVVTGLTNDLVQNLGSSTIPLLTTLLAPQIMKGFGVQPGFAFQGLGTNMMRRGYGMNNFAGDMLAKGGGFLRSGGGFGLLGGALAIGSGVSNIAGGRETQGIANISGGIVGGIIGGLSGNPALIAIGASVGSSAGEAFVNFMSLEGVEIGEAIYNRMVSEAETGATRPSANQPELTQMEQILSAIGGEGLGGSSLGRMLVGGGLRMGNIIETLTGDEQLGGRTFDDFILEMLQRNAPEQYEEMFGGVRAQAEQDVNIDRLVNQYRDTLTGLQISQQELLQNKLISGDVTGAQYVSRMSGIAGIPSIASQFFRTQGVSAGDTQMQWRGLPTDIETVLGEITEIYLNATEEQRSVLANLNASASDLTPTLEELNEGMVELADGTRMPVEAARIALRDIAQAQQELFQQLKVQQEIESFQAPGIVNAQNYMMSQDQIAQVLQIARRMQGAKDEAVYAGMSEAAMEEIRASRQDLLLQLSALQYRNIGGGLEENVLVAALAEAVEKGVIEGNKKSQTIGLQQMGMTTEDWYAIQPYYEQLSGQLVGAGYTLNETDFLGVFENSIIEPVTADLAIIQLLLGSIQENTEDMVDGIYNLPTDGTFMVPFTGYRMGYNNAGGGGLGSAIDRLIEYLVRGQIDAGAPEYSATANLTAQQQQMMSQMPSPDEPAMIPPGYEYTAPTPPIDVLSLQQSLLEAGEVFTGFAGYDPSQYMSGHLNTETLRQMGIETPTGGEISRAIDGLTATMSTMLEPVFNVTVEIDANFKTMLDGQVLADVNKKYMTEEFDQAKTSSGLSLSATI